jgi:hypothetical protein
VSRSRSAVAAIAIAIGCALATTSAGAAELPSITNLRVAGGESTWHPVDNFQLGLDRPAGQPPALAVHYLVKDHAGEIVVPARRIAGDVRVIEQIRVRSGPGLYRAEVWLEGLGGESGPIATAGLRFDDVAPGPAHPVPPGAWITASSPAVVRIGHPAAPLPVSGIRGYAISVDRGTERAPCAGATRCTVAETDLGGGIEDDTISVGLLPEGLSFVRVVAVSGSGMRSATVKSATLRVDATYPQVELRGAPNGWSPHPVRLTATASDALSGMAPAGPAGPYTAIAVDGRTPTMAAGDSVSATAIGDGAHRVAFYARDAAGNVADGEAGAPLPDHAFVRIDETPPRVAFSRAQLAAEPERIEATVTDGLSGPDPARGTIAIRATGSGQPFTALPTTVSNGRLVAHWDSDRYPTGAYEFRATGYDAAGNPSLGDRRLGGARMVLSNPVKEPTELLSGFGGTRLVWHRCSRKADARRCRREAIEGFEGRPEARTVPYGRGTTFSGRLSSSSGAPLGDLPVTVIETFAPNADPVRRETVVRTRPNGTFLVRLAPGPSRQVEAVFSGNRLLSRSGGRPARFGVRSSVRLRVSAATARIGGAQVAFSGRVADLGTSIPAGGMPVELQFRLAGSEWSEFRTVQTDAAGRFRYPYAFTDDDSRGVRFQFRAFLPGQEGWPYEAATSPPVFVTGR